MDKNLTPRPVVVIYHMFRATIAGQLLANFFYCPYSQKSLRKLTRPSFLFVFKVANGPFRGCMGDWAGVVSHCTMGLGVAFLLANTKLRGKVGQSSSPKTVPLCFSTQNKLTLARDLKLPIPYGKGRGKFGGLARTWKARAIFFFGAVIYE